MQKNVVENRDVRKINTDVKVLVLAKCLKLAIKGKPVGAKFRSGGVCYIEPVRIDETGSSREARLMRAGKLRPIAKFTYEHSTVGYKYRYIGPNIKECILAISETLPKEQMQEIARTGAVFTVEEKEGLGGFLRSPYVDTCPVVITVYQEKSGRLPADIAEQNIKFRGQEFSPKDISTIAHAEMSRNNPAPAKTK